MFDVSSVECLAGDHCREQNSCYLKATYPRYLALTGRRTKVDVSVESSNRYDAASEGLTYNLIASSR